MNRKKTLSRLLLMLRPYLGVLILSILLAAVGVVLTLYAPVLIGDAVDLVIGPGQVSFQPLTALLVQLAIVAGLTALVQWLMGVCNNRLTYHIASDLRSQAFSRLHEMPLSAIDKSSFGDTISRITTDVDQISDGLLMGFNQLFTGVVTILGTLGFMLSIHVGISLVVVVLTPLSFFVASFIARHTFQYFQEQSKVRGDMTSLVEEMVGEQKIVKAFCYETRAAERFEVLNQQLRDCGSKAVFYSSLTNPCTRFVNGLVYAGVGIVGAFAALSGNLSVGGLSCFLTYANQYTKPFNEISGVVTELQNALASADRVFALIDQPAQTPDAPDAAILTHPDGTVNLCHVDFSYTPEVSLIEDLNLDVAPGQRIALVGPTGCGKTTIINLLMRFYDVNSGSIRVSGRDIRDYTRNSLRGGWGMVLQDTWLRSGTIRDNIAYADPDATDEQIIAAAKAAHAHGFITRLPQGYDTPIGEDGGSLSAGQKQLLCIARVMLRLPPMLILDEATSSIDTLTEIRIQKAFDRMMEGRTSFVVAHRLSTIQNADLILVMKDGHIIEQGSHLQLLEKGGFYAQLYQSQFATE